MIKRRLLTVILSLAFLGLQGQDLHFSYFEFAPQSVNPALTGNFYGTYRGMGIYRDQYQNANVDGFRTFELAVDAPIIKGFRPTDWIGAGLSFNQDARGKGKLTDTYSRIGLTYHLGLDKKQTRVFSVGAQMNNLGRKLDVNQFTDADWGQSAMLSGIGGTNSDFQELKNKITGEETSITAGFNDWVVGLGFKTRDKKGETFFGISAAHFLVANAGFKDNFDIPIRFTGNFQMTRQINKKQTIEPAVIVQTTRNGFEASAHFVTGYKLKQDSDWKFKGGVGLRTGTFSGIALLGAEYKGWKIGAAYDLPIGGYAAASGVQNAIELAVGYIGFIKKTPKPKPIILCPRL